MLTDRNNTLRSRATEGISQSPGKAPEENQAVRVRGSRPKTPLPQKPISLVGQLRPARSDMMTAINSDSLAIGLHAGSNSETPIMQWAGQIAQLCKAPDALTDAVSLDAILKLRAKIALAPAMTWHDALAQLEIAKEAGETIALGTTDKSLDDAMVGRFAAEIAMSLSNVTKFLEQFSGCTIEGHSMATTEKN